MKGHAPITIDLGVHESGRRDFHARLVIRSPALAHLIQKAIKSKDGRATLAGGGIAVLTKLSAPTAASSKERAT